jgi:uncharacterized GH25 family protein
VAASTRTRSATCAALGALLAGLVLASSAAAHDFWIELSTPRAAAGEPVTARLFVGEGDAGEPFPRDPAHLLRFWAASDAGEAPLAGRRGADPAGVFVPRAPGVVAVGYASRATPLALEPAKFAAYLDQEGLPRVRPGRELFSRCAKALLPVGRDDASGYARVLGLTLELVPERSPFRLEPGDELPLRLLYDGRPLAGALVDARQRGAPAASAGRTDADGRVRLRLPAPGLWVIAAVHMTEAAPGQGAEWESFWASLSFVAPG